VVTFTGYMMIDANNNKNQVSRRFPNMTSALLLWSLAATPVSAQTTESVIVDVGACVNIQTRQQRLECYENRVNEMLRVREFERGANQSANASASRAEARAGAGAESDRQRNAEVAAAAASAQQVAAQEQNAQEEEMSRAERRALRRAEKAQADAQAALEAAAALAAAPAEITATVTNIREIEPNMLLITLDNGQLWRQNRALRYPMKTGAVVTLRPSTWGSSYRLTDPSIGGFIQVERRR
jgi:hypothetical protein